MYSIPVTFKQTKAMQDQSRDARLPMLGWAILGSVSPLRDRRGWKAAGRTQTDVWWYVKVRWLNLFSSLLSFDGNMQSTHKLTPELPVLTLVSWRVPLPRANQRGPLFQQLYLQYEHKPGAGQDVEVISDSQYPCFWHVYTSDRGFCICIIWHLDNYPSHYMGPRVPLKDWDTEQVTITVQVARRNSLSTCWEDSGKRMPGSREGQFFWQRPPPLGIQYTSKLLSSWLQVLRHTV